MMIQYIGKVLLRKNRDYRQDALKINLTPLVWGAALMLLCVLKQPVRISASEAEAEKPDLSQVSAITIKDPADSMYEEALEIELSREETEKFRALARELTLQDGCLKMNRYYRIVLKTADDGILDEWMTDTAHNIVTASGEAVLPDEQLAAWLEEIESSHDLTYSLLDRSPGEEYMALLPLAGKAHLREVKDDPEEEAVDYILTEEEIRELAGLGNGMTVSQMRNIPDDLYYNVNIYDANGSGLYTISADKDKNLYCNGYLISGEDMEVEDFFRRLEEKEGL